MILAIKFYLCQIITKHGKDYEKNIFFIYIFNFIYDYDIRTRRQNRRHKERFL